MKYIRTGVDAVSEVKAAFLEAEVSCQVTGLDKELLAIKIVNTVNCTEVQSCFKRAEVVYTLHLH